MHNFRKDESCFSPVRFLGTSWRMFAAVLGGLMGLNELSRRSKNWSLFLFVAVPVLLTPYWLYMGNEVSNWFVWVKVYSALAGSIGFMVIRFTTFGSVYCGEAYPWSSSK